MKYFGLAIFVLAFTSFPSLSQSTWNWQNPIPQGNILEGIHAVNQDIVYAAGTAGTILKTSDGGSHWDFVSYLGGFSTSLYSIFFINPDTGWAVGSDAVIRKTTDGGSSWVNQSSGAIFPMTSVFFSDDTTGWVASGPELYKTIDGGNQWHLFPTPSPQNKRAIFFLNPLTGWIICSGGDLLRTTNGGDTLIYHSFGTNYHLWDIYFLDEYHGWIVGSTGFGTPEMMNLHNLLEKQLFGKGNFGAEFSPDKFTEELNKTRNHFLAESQSTVERHDFEMQLNP